LDGSKMSPVAALCLQSAILIGLPYFIWNHLRARRIAPLAVVQVICGLALGPSVLGRLSPSLQHVLFGTSSLNSLAGLAAVAVVLFSFVSGMHIERKSFRGSPQAETAIAISGFTVPLLLGWAFGYWLALSDPALVGPNANPLMFGFAIGICMAVTALPVLAAILKEMKIVNTEVGQQALALSAATDALIWLCVSVLLIVTAHARQDWWIVGTFGLYLIIATIFVPRVMQATLRRGDDGQASDATLLAACAFAFTSALASEMAGLGYVIGPFVTGVAMPSAIRKQLIERLDWPVTLLLMPFFFMVTGLRTETDLVSLPVLTLAVLAVVLASTAKVAGVAIPSVVFGYGLRKSLALGVLLQSKGLVEVLVVTVLIDSGIVTHATFSALILSGVTCTMLAMPVVRALLKTPASAKEAWAPALKSQFGDSN
jgi:Kef-type K+ transport system membrane component KefB